MIRLEQGFVMKYTGMLGIVSVIVLAFVILAGCTANTGGGSAGGGSLLDGETRFQGSLPPLASTSYTTRDGTTLTSEFAYEGLVSLLVSDTTSDQEVRSTVTALGGTVLDAIPVAGIYTVQVPRESEASLIAGLLKKSFVIDAAPSSPVTPARSVLIDSFTGEGRGCSPHGKRVEMIAGGDGDRPVKEIEFFTSDVTSAQYPLPGLQVVGNWYPALARKLISEMEDAARSGTRDVIGLSLQSIASQVGNRQGVASTCSNPATAGALNCTVIRQEQRLFLEHIYDAVQRAPPSVRGKTSVVVAAGNAGVDLTEQITALNRLFPDAAKSIKIVGATGDDGNIYRSFNFASSGMVYALGTDVPTGQGQSYAPCSGTSFSAPAVVYILDLMWDAAPSLTSDQLNSAFDDALKSCPDAKPSGTIVPHTSAGTTPGWFIECCREKARSRAGIPPTTPAGQTDQGTATPTGTTGSTKTMTTPPTTVTVTQSGVPGTPLRFTAVTVTGASPGVPYRYSFCKPEPKTATDLCGPGTSNPTGGNPPYHFVLDSGVGFPPMGISLNLNGLLTGIPTVSGPARFRVCAVDLSGDQACQDVQLDVGDTLAGNWRGSYRLGADVSGYCSNMETLVYDGPITMSLTQEGSVVRGSGTVSGVQGLEVGGDASCSPVDQGSFDMTISGTVKGEAVSLDLDFGDPDLFISVLHFDGEVQGNTLSGSLDGEGVASATASMTRQ